MTTSSTAGLARWPESDGVVYDRGGVRWVDVREMSWTATPGQAGRFHKVLARDEHGEPSVFVEYLPPGSAPAARRYHRTVREFVFVLEGELPITEFDGEGDTTGVALVAKRGWFGDRRPGSVYGGSAERPSLTGAVLLRARSGAGTWPADPGFADETVELAEGDGTPARAAASDRAGVMHDRAGITWLDTREMDWQPFSNGEPGHLRKMLCQNPDTGAPAVFLHFLPSNFTMEGDLPCRHYHRTVGEFGYFLEGEIFNAEYATPESGPDHLLKRPNWFMERKPGSIHGADKGQDPLRGCLILQWTSGLFDGALGNWIGDANFDDETVVVGFG